MTTQEKAIDIYNKMYETGFKPKSVLLRIEQAKECALIAVDEILISVYKINFYEYPYDYSMEDRKHLEFWQEVKQEIEKL